MSKKRNLACLLVGKNKLWCSSWCIVKKDYAFFLQEDLLLFVYLRSENCIFNQASLTSVRLFRIYNLILLDLILAENFFFNRILSLSVLHFYNRFFSKRIFLSTYFNNDLQNAFYIGAIITRLIEKRVKFRSKTVKLLLKKVKCYSSGIFIQCSGRLNNTDIARVDKLYLGRVPLQSMNYFLSYSLVIANTVKGLQSIKVWLCK